MNKTKFGDCKATVLYVGHQCLKGWNGMVAQLAGLGIRSFAHRSFRSHQVSDCERFAQIAQDK